MSSRFLSVSSPAMRASVNVGRMAVMGRSFAFSSSASSGLKESSGQADHDKHKQDSLKKQKDGKGHWKPELASDSEEALKADRSGHEDPAALQERTKKAAEETSKAGTSMRDGL